MRHVSRTRLLGLPLLEIHTGGVVDGRYRRGVARAWIAVGDVAFGVLFAAGGVAVGGVGIGGIAVGAFSLGGLALGAAAVGGGALGGWAVGGAAFALHAALGGLAVAGAFAQGGAAVAAHANDAAAADWFAAHAFFRVVERAMDFAILLAALPALQGLARVWRKRTAGSEEAR
jgi:hypothetical protein